MGELLPDGTYQAYVSQCPKCKKSIEVNIQGDIISKHLCQPAINSNGIEVSIDGGYILLDCVDTDNRKIYFTKKEAIELLQILNQFINS